MRVGKKMVQVEISKLCRQERIAVYIASACESDRVLRAADSEPSRGSKLTADKPINVRNNVSSGPGMHKPIVKCLPNPSMNNSTPGILLLTQ